MDKYKCNICGKNHDIFKGIDAPVPEKILEIPDAELEKRVKQIQNSFILDKKIFFFKGDIFIYKEKLEKPFFNWSAWTSISLEDFNAKAEELKNGKNVEFASQLESNLPFYKNTQGLKTKTTININYDYTVITIEEESQLKKDQSTKITEERVIEIMQMIHHNPKRKDKNNFSKSFKKRLTKELKNAEEKYIKNQKDFVINLGSSMTLFQIVSNKMLEKNIVKERGFGLHLSFDGEIEEITKFRNKEYSKEFDYFDLDDIPTYQLDFGKDKTRLEEVIKKIITDVYDEEVEMLELDNFEI